MALETGKRRCHSSIPRIPLSEQAWQSVEHYRAGPAAAGAVNYNKVGETFLNGAATDVLTFNDQLSDVSAYAGELLYSTGNTLENFVPPSCSILTVCAGRVWLVNAEDPTELWPSLEYKTRVGIRFNQGIAFKVTGDGAGGITALASMDGRVIAFKGTAIYVISGAGPNDAGAGSFNPPQAVSLTIGTVLPRSVVATKDGIMFQAATGIWLLDRGLGLTYVGAAVEQYTQAANVVDGSLVNGYTQGRASSSPTAGASCGTSSNRSGPRSSCASVPRRSLPAPTSPATPGTTSLPTERS